MAGEEENTGKRGKSAVRRRTRVPLACDLCKERKVRCDGVKPVCGECQRRRMSGAQCVFSTVISSSRNNSQRDYIRTLHERIRSLETAQGNRSTEKLKASGRPPSVRSESKNHSSQEHYSIEQSIAQFNSPQQVLVEKGTSHHSLSPGKPHLPSPLDSASQSAGGHNDLFTTQSQLGETEGQIMGLTDTSTSQPVSREIQDHKSGEETPLCAEEENQINAMGAACVLSTSSQTERESIYGQSSIVSLMGEVIKGQGQADSLNRSSPIQQVVRRPQDRDVSTTMSAKRIRRFSLPSRKDADHLLDHYWNNVHQFYPWIHFPSFLKAYELLWTSEGQTSDTATNQRVGLGAPGCSQIVFHCALNTILALGCEFSDSTQSEGESPSGEFIARANELFQISLLDEEGLSIVQTLLLFTIYLQSTQRPQQCWGVAGLSLRMAQGIGLHLNYNQSKYSFLEIEMRRRAWHGCVLMDRIVSMSLGRLPTPLENSTIPMFSAIDDEYLTTTTQRCQQPESTFSRVAFAVSNCKLGDILGQILRQLYGQNLDDKSRDASSLAPSDSVDKTMALENSLCHFEEDLPAHLRWQGGISSDDMESKPFLRQRLQIQSKLLHARIMLYRPFANLRNSSLSNQATSGLEILPLNQKYRGGRERIGSMFACRCATICYETAGELIETLHLTIMGRAFGAWWYGLFYLTTACIILIQAETCLDLKNDVDENRLAQLWHLAYQMLDVLKTKHPTASQSAFTLKRLRARAVRSHRAASVSDGGVAQSDGGIARSRGGITQNEYASQSNSLDRNDSQVPPHLTHMGGTMDFDNYWTSEAQGEDTYVNFDESTMQDFDNQGGAFPSTLQGFQSSFGGSLISDTFWGMLDPNYPLTSL